MTQPPALAAALALASIGIHVFPCKARAKEPATPHGFKDATVDPEQIARWWHAEPSLNVAAATGRVRDIRYRRRRPRRRGRAAQAGVGARRFAGDRHGVHRPRRAPVV